VYNRENKLQEKNDRAGIQIENAAGVFRCGVEMLRCSVSATGGYLLVWCSICSTCSINSVFFQVSAEFIGWFILFVSPGLVYLGVLFLLHCLLLPVYHFLSVLTVSCTGSCSICSCCYCCCLVSLLLPYWPLAPSVVSNIQVHTKTRIWCNNESMNQKIWRSYNHLLYCLRIFFNVVKICSFLVC